MERKIFDERGFLKETGHAEYAAGMMEAGERFDVPVIDLFSMSRLFLQKIGNETARKYYMNLEPGEYAMAPDGLNDNSHLKYEGAMLYAGMIAKGLLELGSHYATLIEEDEVLSDSARIEVNG